MNDTLKTGLIVVSAFGLVVAANVLAESIYTNSKVGIDKKPMVISIVTGAVFAGVIIFSINKK